MNPGKTTFSTEAIQGALILRVHSSRLAVHDVELFGKHLDEATSGSIGRTVILDLGEVTLISSVMIGRLFRARKQLLDSEGELKIVAPHPAVRSRLEACDLDRILGVFESLEEALA